MRIVAIALFLFALNLSMAMLNVTGVFTPLYAEDTEWIDTLESSAEGDYQSEAVSTSNTGLGTFGDFVKGLSTFISSVYRAVSIGYTLNQFGVYAPISALVQAGVVFIYVIGLAQFLANRPFRSQT